MRAFENGATRFQFTLTLDARLQKGFHVGPSRVDILLDGYNLLNKGDEIEESQIARPYLAKDHCRPAATGPALA